MEGPLSSFDVTLTTFLSREGLVCTIPLPGPDMFGLISQAHDLLMLSIFSANLLDWQNNNFLKET